MNTDFIRFSNKARIRKEYFGGIIFNRDTGDVIRIDREAFLLLSTILKLGVTDIKKLMDNSLYFKGKRIDKRNIRSVLMGLLDLGILEVLPRGVLSNGFVRGCADYKSTNVGWPKHSCLSAPETVHFAVTFKCGEACPDCYIERHRKQFSRELGTEEVFTILDKIAEKGVFQLAIGGGEPFLRDDLERIVERAFNSGMVVHITTGLQVLDARRIDTLASSIRTLQIGIRNDDIINENTDYLKNLEASVELLHKYNISPGANIIITRSAIENFNQIVDKLLKCGFKRVTLIRYKPPGDRTRWLQENPARDDIEIFEQKLVELSFLHSELTLRVDCAFSFLQRELNAGRAEHYGFKGCTAADSIMSVAPDGSVYPCSQLCGDSFRAGNLLHHNFDDVWVSNTVLNKYRNFRKYKSYKNSGCGRCASKDFCGGCRVFADDALGCDNGCPVCAPTRMEDDEDIISEIQDMIGYTGGGFPYASQEEIEGWLEEDSYGKYPDWIELNET